MCRRAHGASHRAEAGHIQWRGEDIKEFLQGSYTPCGLAAPALLGRAGCTLAMLRRGMYFRRGSLIWSTDRGTCLCPAFQALAALPETTLHPAKPGTHGVYGISLCLPRLERCDTISRGPPQLLCLSYRYHETIHGTSLCMLSFTT